MSAPPRDLGEASLRAIGRSFYLVRMARYAALGVALVLVAGTALATEHPRIAAALGVLPVLIALGALRTRRRYLSSLRRAPGPSSAGSPTP